MATRPVKVVRGKRVRVTAVDECGVPLTGPYDACGYAVSDGFITVTLTADVAEGEDIEQMNANGDLCIVDRSRAQTKRWMAEIEFCDVDPGLLSVVSNVTLETDAEGDVVGIRSVEGSLDTNFALELWAGTAGAACENGATYGYLLLPFMAAGNLGDITVENGSTTFTVMNTFSQSGSGWGVGPWDVVPDAQGDPAPLDDAIGPLDHMVLRTTSIAPPDAFDGCAEIPAA